MTLRFAAETRVDAPCDAVWAVLADLPGWSRWNTVSPVAPAALEVGARWTLALHARGATRHVTVRVVTLEPGRALAWRGGLPVLLDVVHGFELRPDGDGCVITHHEVFQGLLAPLVPRVVGAKHGDMYGAVNARLVEAVVSGRH
jgi:hypothetical protein